MNKYIVASILWAACATSFAASVEGNSTRSGAEVAIIKNKYPEESEAFTHLTKAGSTQVETIDYSVAKVDLNNDGQLEILAEVHNSDFCGAAGCMFVILQKSGHEYTELLRVTAHFPVEVSGNFENGYKTLSFNPVKKWVYTNGKYQ